MAPNVNAQPFNPKAQAKVEGPTTADGEELDEENMWGEGETLENTTLDAQEFYK